MMNKIHFFDEIDCLIESSKKEESNEARIINYRTQDLHKLINALEPRIAEFSLELKKRSANFSFINSDEYIKFIITDKYGTQRFLLLEADKNRNPQITHSPIEDARNYAKDMDENHFNRIGIFIHLMERLIIENYKFRPKISE